MIIIRAITTMAMRTATIMKVMARTIIITAAVTVTTITTITRPMITRPGMRALSIAVTIPRGRRSPA